MEAIPLEATSFGARQQKMIQVILRSSIQKLVAVYFGVAFLVTAAVAACAIHLFSPEVPEGGAFADKPQYDDLDWAPAQMERALLRLADGVADMQLGVASPGELAERTRGLRVAIQRVSENPTLIRSLGTLPEYTGIFMDLSDLLDKSHQLMVTRPAPDLAEFRSETLLVAQEVQGFAEHSQGMEARARVTHNRELSGSRKLLVWLLGLLWIVLVMLGLVAVMALRIQAKRICAYQGVVDARQRALDAANAAEVAQATFLGKISHEINSPLQTILTNIQLLESRTDPDDRRMVVVRRLRTSVRQLCSQVADLLGVAEMKSGLLKLAPENVDVLNCLRETVAVLESAATMKGIYLQLEAEPLGLAYIDGRRLAQILTNLVSNAIRYTDKGGVSVGAEVVHQVPSRTLRLDVRDTGAGISLEAQKHLFEPFADTRTARRGSGLGLSIVKGLVEQMQGMIEYTTRAGEGTLFTVTIPLGAEPVSSFRIESDVTFQGCNVDAGKSRLLLVEDDEAIRETIGELLEDAGYAVTRADTITAGIAELRRRAFDAVVLDLELPDGTGFDLAKTALTTCNAGTPIIAMTAYAELLKKPEARLFAERLIKPVSQQRLRDAIERATQRVTLEAFLRP